MIGNAYEILNISLKFTRPLLKCRSLPKGMFQGALCTSSSVDGWHEIVFYGGGHTGCSSWVQLSRPLINTAGRYTNHWLVSKQCPSRLDTRRRPGWWIHVPRQLASFTSATLSISIDVTIAALTSSPLPNTSGCSGCENPSDPSDVLSKRSTLLAV